MKTSPNTNEQVTIITIMSQSEKEANATLSFLAVFMICVAIEQIYYVQVIKNDLNSSACFQLRK